MRYIQPSCRALRLDDVLLVRRTDCSGEALERRMCAKVDLGPTGVPITAFYAAVEKKWVLDSWDRFVIPMPFSRVLVRVASKIYIARDADDALLEERYQEMQTALDRVTDFAERNLAEAWNTGRTLDS